MNKVLIIAISLLHITLSQAGNIDKGFSIVDDSLKISVSSPQDKVIHVQVVPVGSQPGKSLIIPEISGPISDCQVQKGDGFIALKTSSVTATYSYSDKTSVSRIRKAGKKSFRNRHALSNKRI